MFLIFNSWLKSSLNEFSHPYSLVLFKTEDRREGNMPFKLFSLTFLPRIWNELTLGLGHNFLEHEMVNIYEADISEWKKKNFMHVSLTGIKKPISGLVTKKSLTKKKKSFMFVYFCLFLYGIIGIQGSSAFFCPKTSYFLIP